MSKGTQRIVAFIPADAFVKDHGFRVSFVKEGETGHYPTGTWPYHGKPGENIPWFWGGTGPDAYEKAKETAKKYNERMGLTEQAVHEIVSQSMFPGSGRRT
jgi:hypothetical protein